MLVQPHSSRTSCSPSRRFTCLLSISLRAVSTFALIALSACQPVTKISPRTVVDAGQLVVVVTPNWTSTTGTMTRFERFGSSLAWTRIGSPAPVVVGRTGLAWGVRFDDVRPDEPHKHEGDGKAPAGIFPLDTAFGFA